MFKLAAMEHSMKVPQKTKKRTTIWSSNPTFVYVSKRIESRMLKRYLHTYVHCSIIQNSQEVESTQMSTNEWIKKI